MFSLAFQWLMDLEDFLFGVLSCSSFLLMKVAFSADSWWVSLMSSPSLSLISHKRSTDASHPSWEEEKQYALQDLWDRVGFGRPGFIQLTVWFQAAADTDVTCCCVAGIRKVPLYQTLGSITCTAPSGACLLPHYYVMIHISHPHARVFQICWIKRRWFR